MGEPWDRVAGEDQHAFTAFTAYRDQWRRPRSIPGRAEKFAQCLAWHREFNWEERVALFDAYTDVIRQSARRDRLEDQAALEADRMAGALDDGFELFSAELARLVGMSRHAGEGAGVMKVSDLLKLGELILKWKAIQAGKPSEITESKLDLSGLSQEDRRTLVFLLAKAESK